ncbi:hypothetical protein ASE14_18815 [Agromyces sp. Root81]|nr:hypothetical protein ASE14_18815 [Agromyces sp. Root81]
MSEPLDPWDDYGPEMRRLERELFIARGIPDDWMPWASALRWDFPPSRPLPDSPVDLRVGGDAPPRTLAELVEATSRGVGLGLNLPDGFDLTQLAPALQNVEYLSIGSLGSLTGWDVLNDARALVQLIVGPDVRGAAPTAALPELQRVIGPRGLLEMACAAPKLTELQVDLASESWPEDLGFDGPIEYLEIAHADKVAQPPQFRHPAALKTLRIYNARELDLGTLPPEADLEWLQVFRTKVLHGAATIARMTRLRTLDLESVASIPGAEALSAVTARVVNVRHSDPAAAIAMKR